MPLRSTFGTAAIVAEFAKDSVKFDEDKRHAVYLRDGYRCAYSGYHDETHTGVGLSIDHLVARNRGGDGQGTKGTPGTNLATASMVANRAKSDKSPQAFNAFLKGSTPPDGGLKPIDFAAVRQQSAKKLDLVRGAQLADLARQARECRDKKTGATLPGKEEKLAEIVKQSTAIVATHQAEQKAKADKKTPPSGAAPAPTAPRPAGPGIQHGPDGKFQPGGAASRPRVAFVRLRRHADAFTSGDVTTAFRILAAGENATDKGPLIFTPESAKMVMAAFAARGNPFVGYYEHEDQLPIEKRGGAPMRGECSAPTATLAVRGPAPAPECWAQDVGWTDEAKHQITTGKRRQISPVAAFDKDTREVLEIINFSLCSEGATHFGTLLASKGPRGPVNMDDIMDQIMDAIGREDWEAAESLIQQAEAGDEGMARYAKMARMAMKAKAPPAPPPAPIAPATAATRLAASRTAALLAGDVDAFTRATADMAAATRDSRTATTELRRETVLLKLSKAREDGLLGPDGDPVTEREHLSIADPAATERYIAGLRRMVKVGVLVLGKPVATTTEPNPGGKPDDKTGTFGLTEVEISTAKQNNVTLEAFARSKERVNVRTTGEPGRA